VEEPDTTWTWPDLLDATLRLTARQGESGRAEQYGLCYHFDHHFWPAFLCANGGGLATPDGSQPRLGQAAAVEAVQFAVDLVYRHKVAAPPTTGYTGDRLFVLRRTAMSLSSYYGIDSEMFPGSGIDWDITLVPGAPARTHHFWATGVAVNRQTPHLSAALAFVDFLLSPQTQGAIRSYGASLPVRASVVEDVRLHDPYLHPSHSSLYLQAMQENDHVPPFLSAKAAGIVQHELALAFADLEDVPSACTRAAAALGVYLRERLAQIASVR
jgi:multiple sugar transport system substrate-binding protein